MSLRRNPAGDRIRIHPARSGVHGGHAPRVYLEYLRREAFEARLSRTEYTARRAQVVREARAAGVTRLRYTGAALR